MIKKEEFIEILNGNYKFIDTVSKRKDMTAFMLLDDMSGDGDIIGYAEHDKIYFSCNVDELCAKAVNMSAIELLSSCGVMYDEECDCLTMFV